MIIGAIYGMTERRGHVLAEISQADRLEWNGLPMSPCAFKGGNHKPAFAFRIGSRSDSVEKLSAGRAQLRPFRFQARDHRALIRD